MRVLVTGGTGFLGRHLVWRLIALGHEVVFTGRSHARASAVLAGAARTGCKAGFVELEHGSPTAATTLMEAAADADAVIHCAALSSPWGPRLAFERANVDSTREVIEACAAHRIGKLIYISTPSLYFDFRDRIGIREDEPLPPPVNDYARTKGIAEKMAQASSIDSVIALRPRAIFGAWDETLLPRILRVARTARLPLMRGGGSLIDLTYVENVVDAVMLALDADLERATVNISNGEPIPVHAMFAKLADAFAIELRVRRVPYRVVDAIAATLERVGRVRPGWEPPITRYSAGLLAFSQTLDLTRARELLGYTPRISLDAGLARTAAWFAALGRGRE
jgi:nucleoside-diphosphate-sugar epimerase